jgi:polysaccharide export outer membrane protein
MMKSKDRTLVVLSLLSLIVACGSSPRLPPPTTASAGADGAGVDEASYRIGPGDTLEVFVWRNPEISTSVEVRPDGMISTPLVEDMVAVGKTPSQLARDMETVLATYIKSPSVNIIVSGFRGTPGDMIRVVGQAQNPQAIPYRDGMTVLDVMIAVGGLGEFAAGNKAKLIRRENGTIMEYRIRLGDLLNKGEIEENVTMQPGDVIIIPETFF